MSFCRSAQPVEGSSAAAHGYEHGAISACMSAAAAAAYRSRISRIALALYIFCRWDLAAAHGMSVLDVDEDPDGSDRALLRRSRRTWIARARPSPRSRCIAAAGRFVLPFCRTFMVVLVRSFVRSSLYRIRCYSCLYTYLHVPCANVMSRSTPLSAPPRCYPSYSQHEDSWIRSGG